MNENNPNFYQINNIQQRPARSLPIPKEVNKFVLIKYGSVYYHAQFAERIRILKEIELQLKNSGYNISWCEIERRLKNMKSHYRLKKRDMELGITASVEWEYFEMLDKIFQEQNIAEVPRVVGESQKRKAEGEVEEKVPAEVDHEEEQLPQDLSTKRPRVIEFTHINELNQLIPQAPPVDQNQSSNIAALKKIIESIRTVDEQRLVIDQQRINLEVRRYELDVLGYQLSDLLFKLSRPSPPETSN